jgi:hypothetical protein
METTKPRKQSRNRYFGGFEFVVVIIRTANAMREPRSDQRVICIRRRVVASAVFAQTIMTTNRGAVNI